MIERQPKGIPDDIDHSRSVEFRTNHMFIDSLKLFFVASLLTTCMFPIIYINRIIFTSRYAKMRVLVWRSFSLKNGYPQLCCNMWSFAGGSSYLSLIRPP